MKNTNVVFRATLNSVTGQPGPSFAVFVVTWLANDVEWIRLEESFVYVRDENALVRRTLGIQEPLN